MQHHSRETPAKRGQVVRVQVSNKQANPLVRNTAPYIRHNQIMHSEQLTRGFMNDS